MAMKKKLSKKKKVIMGVIVGYLAIMLIGYMGIAFYFSSHFFNGTKVNGMNCGNKTVEQVKEDIIQDINSYTLQIELRGGGTEKIKAPDVELSYVDDNRVDELMTEQNQYEWPVSFSADKKYELAANTTYNKELVDTVMNEMSCLQENNMEKPQNAYIEDTGDVYEIIPEVQGNELDREKVKAAIIEAIDTGKTSISLEELDCYKKPTILSDNEKLAKQVEALNRMTAASITYDFGDDRLEVVDRTVIKDWLVEGEDGSYTIDNAKAEAFVQEMAYEYDTFGLKHEFTTHAGDKITLSSGDYGWCINKTKTTEALIEAINQGLNETRDPVYLYSAMNKGVDDIGGTYVEISLEQQTMWCYKDGNVVVETLVVTGNPSKGNATPSGGCWAIDAKKQDAILKGEGYSSPVTFWMPFNGNVGIHDADRWRSEYGGDIYKSSGSHGCVNTPYANAEKIFNTVEIGTPVIVY